MDKNSIADVIWVFAARCVKSVLLQCILLRTARGHLEPVIAGALLTGARHLDLLVVVGIVGVVVGVLA